MTRRRTVRLRDVLTRVSRPVRLADDSLYSTLGVRWYGAGCFLKAPLEGRRIAANSLFAVEPGDVVYSRLFAWKGSFGVVKAWHAGAVASNEFPMYRATDDLVPEYFELWASREAVWAKAESGSTGTTANSRNRLGEAAFLDLTIALPSLEEQTAAVDAAGHLRRLADATRAQALTARKLLESLWSQAWIDELAAVAPQRLADVTEVSSGGTPSRQCPEYFLGDIPWVKTGEVTFNELAETREHITSAAVSRSSAKVLPPGTVVVAMYGQGATRGRCAILTREMSTNQACAGIKPCDALDPRYLFHWLWWSYERIRGQAEGSSQPNLSKRIIENLALPIPSIEKQAEIVERLDVALRCERALITEALAAEDLRRATIAGLVSGELGIVQFMDSAVA